jgi:excisionase family DNA binding protein
VLQKGQPKSPSNNRWFWLLFFFGGKMKDEFIDINGAAAFLKLSKWTIYQMTRRNEIPCSRPSGTKLIFSKAELTKWVKNKRN